MATTNEIANLAIAAHSGDWVSDYASAPGRTPEAIRTIWNTTLETALAAHPWKFAKRSWRDLGALPADQNPDPDALYAYAKPPDCVRVFELSPKADFWEWGGDDDTAQEVITSIAGPVVTMIGTRRNVDVGRFSAFFVNYFAALLAAGICTSINASEAIRKRCKDDVTMTFAAAASDNGRAGTVRRQSPDTFLAARRGGGGSWR